MSLTHINVRANGEYGDFYLLEGSEPAADGRTRHWCQLTCNTAFGVVGHTWCSMGMPAARFLSKISKDYALDKLWALNTEVYDEDTARTNMQKYLVKRRREDGISSDRARELWDDLKTEDLSFEHCLIQFVYGDAFWQDAFGSDTPRYKIRNPQAEGFWKTLWPSFLAGLKANSEVVPHA